MGSWDRRRSAELTRYGIHSDPDFVAPGSVPDSGKYTFAALPPARRPVPQGARPSPAGPLVLTPFQARLLLPRKPRAHRRGRPAYCQIPKGHDLLTFSNSPTSRVQNRRRSSMPSVLLLKSSPGRCGCPAWRRWSKTGSSSQDFPARRDQSTRGWRSHPGVK